MKKILKGISIIAMALLLFVSNNGVAMNATRARGYIMYQEFCFAGTAPNVYVAQGSFNGRQFLRGSYTRHNSGRICYMYSSFVDNGSGGLQ